MSLAGIEVEAGGQADPDMSLLHPRVQAGTSPLPEFPQSAGNSTQSFLSSWQSHLAALVETASEAAASGSSTSASPSPAGALSRLPTLMPASITTSKPNQSNDSGAMLPGAATIKDRLATGHGSLGSSHLPMATAAACSLNSAPPSNLSKLRQTKYSTSIKSGTPNRSHSSVENTIVGMASTYPKSTVIPVVGGLAETPHSSSPISPTAQTSVNTTGLNKDNEYETDLTASGLRVDSFAIRSISNQLADSEVTQGIGTPTQHLDSLKPRFIEFSDTNSRLDDTIHSQHSTSISLSPAPLTNRGPIAAASEESFASTSTSHTDSSDDYAPDINPGTVVEPNPTGKSETFSQVGPIQPPNPVLDAPLDSAGFSSQTSVLVGSTSVLRGPRTNPLGGQAEDQSVVQPDGLAKEKGNLTPRFQPSESKLAGNRIPLSFDFSQSKTADANPMFQPAASYTHAHSSSEAMPAHPGISFPSQTVLFNEDTSTEPTFNSVASSETVAFDSEPAGSLGEATVTTSQNAIPSVPGSIASMSQPHPANQLDILTHTAQSTDLLPSQTNQQYDQTAPTVSKQPPSAAGSAHPSPSVFMKPVDAAPSHQFHSAISALQPNLSINSLQSQAASDSLILTRDPSSTHVTSTTSSNPQGSSVTVPGNLVSETFASLDSATQSGTPTWIHASLHHAEAGFQDPSLGWVGVRADTSGGQVHATVVPASVDAAQQLGGHLAGLHSYLAETHASVGSLTLAPSENRETPLFPSQGQGQSMHQHGRHERPPDADRMRAVGVAPANISSELAASRVNSSGPIAETLAQSGAHISVIA